MSSVSFERVRTWMYQEALPAWASAGVDRHCGGFFEELSLLGAPTACNYKRVRTLCRQTYVFSHAATLGWAQADALSQWGYEYLLSRAKLTSGGWARRLSNAGEIIDAAPDLYDLAFVIFAMVWRYRASGDPVALEQARATLDFIRKEMEGPDAGFWHALPPDGPRQQNPHMHLAEACLAAFEATQDEVFLATANEVIELLRTRLFDGETLGERFSANWDRLAGPVEPGHHFEWVWILGQHANLTGTRANLDLMQSLLSFAERHGVSPRSGAVYDAVKADGAPERTSSRVWPNTERIKAHLAAYEVYGHDPRPAVGQSLELIFNRYFAPPATAGMWTDQFAEDGTPLVHAVPASCVYHLFLAFAEVLRLQPSLERLEAR